MVLPLDAGVVGGVEVEDEELLREGGRLEEVEEAAVGGRGRGEAAEEDREGGVEGEGEGDEGVLEVAEVLGGGGAAGAGEEELGDYEGGCDQDDGEGL